MRRRSAGQTILKSTWFVAAYGALIALAVSLGFLASQFDQFPGDLSVSEYFRAVDGPALETLMAAISGPGYLVPAVAITLVVALGLWALRRYLEAVFTLATLSLGVLNLFVKLLVNRPRPDPQFVDVIVGRANTSFPSGHVTHYVVFYGFLFYLAWTRLPRSWLRSAILGLCSVLVITVGCSRVYLGVHWPSDVLGGYVFGALYLTALIVAFRMAEG